MSDRGQGNRVTRELPDRSQGHAEANHDERFARWSFGRRGTTPRTGLSVRCEFFLFFLFLVVYLNSWGWTWTG